MNEERVTIPSGELQLEGLLAIPEGSSEARGAVICHPHPQYGGSMHNNVVAAALDAMWRLQMATLRFNFRGVGASSGDYAGGAGETDDARAAMRFLLERPGVAKHGAIMAGYSFGAAVAMRAGMQTDEVDTIVAIALPLAMGNFATDAQPAKRIILVSGDSDDYCPETTVKDFAERLGSNASLRIIEGADHFFGGFEETVSEALVDLIGAR